MLLVLVWVWVWVWGGESLIRSCVCLCVKNLSGQDNQLPYTANPSISLYLYIHKYMHILKLSEHV
ncbi:hypothetical protein Hanom_Chr17g01567681 [Helianthus anomalus]